ncbi:MAG: hypothetical protein Q4G43_09695 [Mobilicoccus sp.]|nr:hypothetical protein [Mobilicoccus sp.]
MDYRSFFRLVTGKEPHPYQCRLAEEGLPEVLEVPTGAGKTFAVVVAWFYRLLAHPDPAVRAATPRRLVYGLPIGVLVEAVTAEAREVWAKLDKARDTLDLPESLPETLPVLQLMGGTLDRGTISDWQVGMDRPSVVVGTVDQVVSRQLSRGYGVSRKVYTIDFALVANGAHVVVDEIQLCGQATSTARQIAAFQRGPATPGTRDEHGFPYSPTAEPAGLTCMSATAEAAYLDTVDAPWQGPPTITLTDADRKGHLRQRLSATRRITYLAAVTKDADVADTARDQHVPGTLTLVVVNRVDEAVAITKRLRTLLPPGDDTPPITLVHSRFRGIERAGINETLTTLTGEEGLTSLQGKPGHIVVATQTVEAGVDLDAATLITEAAPWPSICQRAGRCNRAGTFGAREDTTARLLWFDVKRPAPYDKADVAASTEALGALEGAAVTSADLLGRDVARSPDELSILRSPTFMQLFDTAPDLTGGDIDVTRYIRSDRDTDVRVAWVESDAIDGDAVLARPDTAWQVSVPLSVMRTFIKQKGGPRAWVYDRFSETWQRVRDNQPIMPQDLVLVARADGGYTPEFGFEPTSKVPVAPIHSGAEEPAEQKPTGTDRGADDAGSDPASFTADWQRLDDHLAQAADAAHQLCGALDLTSHGFDSDTERAVVVAVALHDLGKSFPGWQEALRATVPTNPDDPLANRPPGGLLAKSMAGAARAKKGDATRADAATHPTRRLIVRADPVFENGSVQAAMNEDGRRTPARRPQRRRVFRHELVSVLLLRSPEGRSLLTDLGVPPHRHTLVDYLIGAHHGTLRISPRDPVVDGRDGSMFLGVIDGEQIPGVQVGDVSLPGVTADLSIFSGGEGSWGNEAARLLEEFGPFRLGYLETVVRISDWRASGAMPATDAAGGAR